VSIPFEVSGAIAYFGLCPDYPHLQTLGVEYRERRTRPDGVFQIYVKDPDGHTIELCTAPVETT
jgi:catechol 2,3-dioxygenase-like lactoylglutathione lyase family enzyme